MLVGAKLLAGDGETARTACARVLVRGGTDEKTGEALPVAVVAERVAWCAALVRDMAAGLLGEHWNAADVGALASGRDPAGRPLPSQAWMALRRLGWAAPVPEGVTVNDRVVRMAQEQAGRLLRSGAWRAALTGAALADWPARPDKRTPEEWDAVRAAMPGGEHVPSGMIRARTRQALRFLGAQGRLPRDVFELEAPPAAAGMLPLAACDRQQATLERSAADPGRALLRLQLPVRPDPRGYRDWTWVALPLILPPTVPPAAVLHLPSLQAAGGRTRVGLPFTHAVPAARRAGHVIALGLDWGLNTLLSAGAARLHADGTISLLGAGSQYRAAGVLAKVHRLRRHGERLHAKTGRYEKLGAGHEEHPLDAKASVLAEENRRVSERRSRLNDALAWSAARWAVDQAIAAGASVVYIEDLRTLEARGMGRTMNPPVPDRPRADRGQDPAPRCGAGDRGRRRPRPRHLEMLPALPGAAAAPQGPW